MQTDRRSPILIGLLLVLLCLGCQQASSDVQAENKALVRQMFAAIDGQDFGQLSLLLHDDFLLHYVGAPEPMGREAAFNLIRGFYAAFPDYTHVIEEMIAEGNRVAVKMNYHATHQGEFQSIMPTGNRISYAGSQMVTVVDGAVMEIWALEDNLSLMMQLGMQLAPVEPGP